MSIKRRLSPEESRTLALNAARELLIDTGPQSVTLKAVAARIGRTHANVLHHFGSAAGLQTALAAHIAQGVCASIARAVEASRAGIGSPRDVVDLTFDAFGRGGGGALASWMLLSGNEDALDPILGSIHTLVDELHPGEVGLAEGRTMHEATLTLVLLALGDALMGEALSGSLGVERGTARNRAEAMLVASLGSASEPY